MCNACAGSMSLYCCVAVCCTSTADELQYSAYLRNSDKQGYYKAAMQS